MRIAVAQVHAPPVAQSSNEVEVHALGLDRLRGLMCATARGGGDLLVLPELWLGGYHTGGSLRKYFGAFSCRLASLLRRGVRARSFRRDVFS